MTWRSLHYTVSVSSPCWSNPSQPPKGRCNERTGSVSLITVGAEGPGTLDIMRNCVISSASLRVTQLDIMLSACLSSSWHPFPLSPYESSAGRGVFAQGPSPALARRKTPYFAGPRPQSTWFLPPPALRCRQRRWSCGRGLPPDHLPCLPLPCWVAPAPSVSNLKSWSVPAPFSHSTNNSFSSAHFLRSRSKVSRFAACVYTAAPVDCQAEPVSPLPQHTPLPLVAACPWLLPDSLPTFSKAVKETVSNQG